MTDKELEKIYNEAYKAVYWTAFSLLKNEADAEDIVQDTFVTLIESYDSLQDKSKVLPWLKKIAANKSLNRLSAARTDNVEDEFFDTVEAVPEDFLPDSIVESEDTRRVVMDIINNTLSDDVRRTLILFYFDEMSIKEISLAQGIPEGTVSWRLNFAKKKIKKEVEKYEEDNKTKLFGMAALPFLSKLFIAEAEQVPFKAMPASLMTTLSASAQVSAQGAGIKVAASAAKKGTGIMMKKVLIGSIAAVVAVGVIIGVILVVLRKHDDTKPESTKIHKEADDRRDEKDTEPADDSSVVTAKGSAATDFCATGKITTEYGDYYLKETFKEFLEQFDPDKYEIKISDKEGNKYTMDDMDTVIDSKFVSATVKVGINLVCNITTQRVSGVKLGDIKIEMFKTDKLTTSLELNGCIIELGKTTVDEIVAVLGDYSKRTQTDEKLHIYPFIFEGFELGQYDVCCNEDGTVKYISINAIDTYHKLDG